MTGNAREQRHHSPFLCDSSARCILCPFAGALTLSRKQDTSTFTEEVRMVIWACLGRGVYGSRRDPRQLA